MHQWKALVKPAFDHQITEFDHEYLILITRFTEILVPKQEYRVRTGAEYSVRCPIVPRLRERAVPRIALLEIWVLLEYSQY